MANVTSADSSDRSKAESARLWVQAVAVPVVATLFTLVAFYYKEIFIPSTAPINLTTDVSVESAGRGAVNSEQDKGLEAIELTVTASNPSSRTIYLLANSWLAYGYKVTAFDDTDEEEGVWLKTIPEAISAMSSTVVQGKHYKRDDGTLLALGNVFRDSLLHPNEKVSATYVFHVPQGMYDYIHIEVDIPTASRENPYWHGYAAIMNFYSLSDERGLSKNLYRWTSQDQLEKLPLDKNGDWLQADIKEYGLQTAGAAVNLSLWQGKTKESQTESALVPQ
jgi:hypothetical protein